MKDRAAVVVGVDKTGGLTSLKSAAAGAKSVAKWLDEEGNFDVKLLTDDSVPVLAKQIEDAIDAFVRPPIRYRMLLLYFSGHGIWHARSDIWMLSQAPGRSGEAVNLAAAIDTARYCGIPNVVFISDACRSLPADINNALLSGQSCFPSYDIGASAAKVDVFRATTRNKAAYEAVIGSQTQSLLTKALLSAYVDPPEAICRKLGHGQAQFEVVPNRLLEDHLQETVDDLLDKIDPSLQQPIEVEVPSDDDIYIGRARRTVVGGGTWIPPLDFGFPGAGEWDKLAKAESWTGGGSSFPDMPKPAPSQQKPRSRVHAREEIGRAAQEGVRSALGLGEASDSASGGTNALAAMLQKLEKDVTELLPAADVTSFDGRMGFALTGAGVRRAGFRMVDAPGPIEALIPKVDGSAATLLNIQESAKAASVIIELDDHRCLLLPAFEGYVGHCRVGRGGLRHVSYVPLKDTHRWPAYQARRETLDMLRANVAVAAHYGKFRLHSRKDAGRLAEELFQSDPVDPTLGLYAAYAFAEAGRSSLVARIRAMMAADLGVELFDLAMLTRRPGGSGQAQTEAGTLPAVPLLTAGWNLVASRQMPSPDWAATASSSLAGSLWTTFAPGCADTLFEAN
ncbi:hypothetical protein DK26_07735 [Bosea sp. WAO]|uniref:caspase family protein n=1 Tax=Bosea sp. WAO TaxID=406341 RepID=UPI0007473C60|nr:caspase family protein [Bosea sp. WAO]KUL96633.1 hypothetical protein DK26_07735 [Bosea sp. WAO]